MRRTLSFVFGTSRTFVLVLACVLLIQSFDGTGFVGSMDCPVKGGLYKEMDSTGDGCDKHHIPSAKALLNHGLDPKWGAVVNIKQEDHKKTRTYGSSLLAGGEREKETEEIAQLGLIGAFDVGAARYLEDEAPQVEIEVHRRAVIQAREALVRIVAQGFPKMNSGSPAPPTGTTEIVGAPGNAPEVSAGSKISAKGTGLPTTQAGVEYDLLLADSVQLAVNPICAASPNIVSVAPVSADASGNLPSTEAIVGNTFWESGGELDHHVPALGLAQLCFAQRSDHTVSHTAPASMNIAEPSSPTMSVACSAAPGAPSAPGAICPGSMNDITALGLDPDAVYDLHWTSNGYHPYGASAEGVLLLSGLRAAEFGTLNATLFIAKFLFVPGQPGAVALVSSSGGSGAFSPATVVSRPMARVHVPARPNQVQDCQLFASSVESDDRVTSEAASTGRYTRTHGCDSLPGQFQYSSASAISTSSTSPYRTNLTGNTDACGMHVSGNMKLEEDIGPCPSNGLVVAASNVEIDLNGHTIFGDGDPTQDDAGILVPGQQNVLVTDSSIENTGTVSLFNAGIVVEGGSQNVVRRANAIANLGYAGPHLSAGETFYGDGIMIIDSDQNTVEDNYIASNGPRGGISLLGKSNNNAVTGNVVTATASHYPLVWYIGIDGVGIRLETTHEAVPRYNKVTENVVTGSEFDGIALFRSYSDEELEIRGISDFDRRANYNEVKDNILESNGRHGIIFWADESEWEGTWEHLASSPEENRIYGNTVCANGGHGIGVLAHSNYIEGNQVGIPRKTAKVESHPFVSLIA